MVLRGAGFAGNGLSKAVFETQAHPAALRHHTLHQINHQIGGLFVHGLLLHRRKFFEHHAVFVFNAGNEHGVAVNAFVGVGGHGRCHLFDRNIHGAETNGGHRFHLRGNAHLPRQGNHGIGRKTFDEIGRNEIDRVRQGPTQAHHLALAFVAGVLGAPVVLSRLRNANRHVGHLGAGRVFALLHGERINKRLESRTYLPRALRHVVVLKILIVDAAHIGAYIARLRLDGHQPAMQKPFVIPKRIPRRHHRIDFATPRKDFHARFGLETF